MDQQRVIHGREAIAVGTPDFDQNDLITNATDTIANVFHALIADGGYSDPESLIQDVCGSVELHVLAELEA